MSEIDEFLTEGDVLTWGGFAARVLHTPGHTPGSISLVVERQSTDASAEGTAQGSDQEFAGPASGHAGPNSLDHARLLAGDTLFQSSIGRTDLWGGSYPQIIESIREKLLVLPDEVVVYPGHGAQTTIGAEREHNPFLR